MDCEELGARAANAGNARRPTGRVEAVERSSVEEQVAKEGEQPG